MNDEAHEAAPEWRLCSETGPLTDVLLARPDHFRWLPLNAVAKRSLAEGRAADPRIASAQHAEMTAMLRDLGVHCHFLNTAPELPLQVYTRDACVVTPFGPVLLQLLRDQRRGEIGPMIHFFCPGNPPPRVVTAGIMEGGDVHVVQPGLLIVGYSGERTTAPAAEQMRKWFEDLGWEVRVQPFPEHFLHLDCLFCMVAEGLAPACDDVLDDDFLAFLAQRSVRTLKVSYKDVMTLGTNVLALGRDRVLSSRANARVNALLRAEGLDVFAPDISEFTPMGGGVHCMTMPLKRADRRNPHNVSSAAGLPPPDAGPVGSTLPSKL